MNFNLATGGEVVVVVEEVVVVELVVVVTRGRVEIGATGTDDLDTVVVAARTIVVEVEDEVALDGRRMRTVVVVERCGTVVVADGTAGVVVVVVGAVVVVVVGAVVVVVVGAGTTAVVVNPPASLPTES